MLAGPRRRETIQAGECSCQTRRQSTVGRVRRCLFIEKRRLPEKPLPIWPETASTMLPVRFGKEQRFYLPRGSRFFSGLRLTTESEHIGGLKTYLCAGSVAGISKIVTRTFLQEGGTKRSHAGMAIIVFCGGRLSKPRQP